MKGPSGVVASVAICTSNRLLATEDNMQRPLEIRFHQMASSPAIEARIREKAAELERFFDRITGCRVIVEREHRHHHKGNLFRVRVEIDAPGKELAVTHSGPLDHAHEDVYVAIRDAFNAAVRRLEDHVRERGGKVKAHEVPLHGTVRMVDHEGSFGFVETAKGEVYFHRNSLVEGEFDDIAPGSEVRLEVAERESAEGWQATTVRLIGKHHLPQTEP
jgi:ribosomal subunit interface protein